MTPELTDTIVIGAGLAGLTTAHHLHKAGHRVIVFEARDRVGGRTYSKNLGGTIFDLGGQWLGTSQKRMMRLTDDLGFTRYPTFCEGQSVLDLGGKVSRYSGTIPRIAPWKLIRLQLAMNRIEHLRRKVVCDAPWKTPNASILDGTTVFSWLQRHAKNEDVIAIINTALRVVFGADSNELSLLHFLFYTQSSQGLMNLVETKGGNQEFRLKGGMQQVSQCLADALPDVRLNVPVDAIAQDEDGVTVSQGPHHWRASRVVVAIPPPILGHIAFTPALPTLRAQMDQRISMGATIKCFAQYPEAFWRKAGLSGEAVCTDGPVSVTYDNTTATGKPCLLAFVVGAPARGWAEQPQNVRRDVVLHTFARYFGPLALKPTCYDEINWATEPWSQGAPIANFPPGTLSVFGAALRKPVGRIHWAGTETATEFTGFMEGAVQSGERAAEEILACR
jgi:monoamine oxidase